MDLGHVFLVKYTGVPAGEFKITEEHLMVTLGHVYLVKQYMVSAPIRQINSTNFKMINIVLKTKNAQVATVQAQQICAAASVSPVQLTICARIMIVDLMPHSS